jgi:acetate kinase
LALAFRKTLSVKILCLDAGSSSLKFAVFESDNKTLRPLVRGAAEGLGQPSSHFWTKDATGNSVDDDLADSPLDSAAALDRVFSAMAKAEIGDADAIGHRIVFGGPDHVAPTLVTPELLADLDRFVPFDPMHLRSQLDLVIAVSKRNPNAKQVACFDTAFHQRMPSIAKRIPLPRSVGPLIQRYGYHGLSFEYIISALGNASAGRVLIAHLGSGASLAAVRDGQPVDTTMGFSPLGGLMMGTRPGDLDPGVLLYLVGANYTALELETLLTERSGLLGVSGVSSSMETLLSRASEDRQSMDAIELFVYQVRKHAGAMIAILGGVDTLVFTGGIGEHAAPIRGMIADGLLYAGVRVDPVRNAASDAIISRDDSHVTVRVIPTDESQMIARHVQEILVT